MAPTHMSALLKTGLNGSLMEFVLTPRGKDMIPILGPVVTISLGKTISHSCILNNLLEMIFQFFLTHPWIIGRIKVNNHS